MVGYPSGKKGLPQNRLKIGTENRGASLEQDINQTNQYYLDTGKANVHKKPTPIQIVTVDYPKRSAVKITEAYFKTPSTTDYNGVYQGKALDFEAKETNSKTSFPFSSLHKHQIEHLDSVLKHQAIAFLLVRFVQYDETYYVEASKMIPLYYGKRRSLPYEWFQKEAYLIPYSFIAPVNYLAIIDRLYFKGESK